MDNPHADPHHTQEPDPSNPRFLGLPIGVVIAACISAVAVGLTLLKFL